MYMLKRTHPSTALNTLNIIEIALSVFGGFQLSQVNICEIKRTEGEISS